MEAGTHSPWACGLVSLWPLGTEVGSVRMCPGASLLGVPSLTLVNSLSATTGPASFCLALVLTHTTLPTNPTSNT